MGVELKDWSFLLYAATERLAFIWALLSDEFTQRKWDSREEVRKLDQASKVKGKTGTSIYVQPESKFFTPHRLPQVSGQHWLLAGRSLSEKQTLDSLA